MAWSISHGPVRTVTLPGGGTRMEFPGADVFVRRPSPTAWKPQPMDRRLQDAAIRNVQRRAQDLAEKQQRLRDQQRREERNRQLIARRKDITNGRLDGTRFGITPNRAQFAAGPTRHGVPGYVPIVPPGPGRAPRPRTPLPLLHGLPFGHGADFKVSGVINKVPGQPVRKPAKTYSKPAKKRTVWDGKYVFPIRGPCLFRNNWGSIRGPARPGLPPRTHKGIDIFAADGTDIVALVSGQIAHITQSKRGGKMLFLRGDDGRSYGYAHLGSFAPSLKKGMRVNAGDVVAKLGRTGVKWSPTHLHIQMYPDHRLDNKNLINPYELLKSRAPQVWGKPITISPE